MNPIVMNARPVLHGHSETRMLRGCNCLARCNRSDLMYGIMTVHEGMPVLSMVKRRPGEISEVIQAILPDAQDSKGLHKSTVHRPLHDTSFTELGAHCGVLSMLQGTLHSSSFALHMLASAHHWRSGVCPRPP